MPIVYAAADPFSTFWGSLCMQWLALVQELGGTCIYIPA